MLASFKGGTAFVEAGIDEIDDTETAGEGGTFVVGTGVSKTARTLAQEIPWLKIELWLR